MMISFTGVKASTTARLFLKGFIPELLSITINAEPSATSLDLTTTQTDLKVAKVKEKSNSRSGYDVTISSANNGSLVHSEGGSVAYTMKYDGQSLDLSTTQVLNRSYNSSVSENKDLSISYIGQDAETTKSGNYEDTLTFTIQAK